MVKVYIGRVLMLCIKKLGYCCLVGLSAFGYRPTLDGVEHGTLLRRRHIILVLAFVY
jgi:hypothetical protein